MTIPKTAEELKERFPDWTMGWTKPWPKGAPPASEHGRITVEDGRIAVTCTGLECEAVAAAYGAILQFLRPKCPECGSYQVRCISGPGIAGLCEWSCLDCHHDWTDS